MVARLIRGLVARPPDLAVAVLALVGFASLAYEASSRGRALPAVAIAAAFVLDALLGLALVRHLGGRSRALPALHVGLLLVLGFATFTTAAPIGSTLLLLVVVSQTVLLLPLWAAALVTVLVPFVHLGMALPDGLRNGFGTLAAAVFTAVLTELLQREHRSRTELTEAHHRLQDFAAQAEELATAQERNRVARDIHDGLGHHLTVVRMQLAAARALLGSDRDGADRLLESAQGQTAEALDEVRRSVAALREPRSRGPLAPALESLAAEASAAGLGVRFTVSGTRRPVAPALEEALYRVAEEGLTNVRKHAQATRALLVLDYAEDRVRVEVHDDGVGLDPAADSGFGLVGLRERVERLDGTVHLGPALGGGLTLAAEVPG